MSTASGYDLTPYPLVDETETAAAPDGTAPTSKHTDCTEATETMLAVWADAAIPATAQTREALDMSLPPVDTGHDAADGITQCLRVFGHAPHVATSYGDLWRELDSASVVAAVTGWYVNADLTRAYHRIAIGPRLAPDVYVVRDPMGWRLTASMAQITNDDPRHRWGGLAPWSSISAAHYTLRGEWQMDPTVIPDDLCDVSAGPVYADAACKTLQYTQSSDAKGIGTYGASGTVRALRVNLNGPTRPADIRVVYVPLSRARNVRPVKAAITQADLDNAVTAATNAAKADTKAQAVAAATAAINAL